MFSSFVMGQEIDSVPPAIEYDNSSDTVFVTESDLSVIPYSEKPTMRMHPKVNHWSVAGHVGVGFMDGDQSQDYNTLWPRSGADCSFGFEVEYTFTPIFGLYTEYMYSPYRGGTTYWFKGSSGQTNLQQAIDFEGLSHEVNVGLSLNFLNLFYRYRSQTWNLYLSAGAGVAFYDVKAYERGTTTIVDKVVQGQHITPSIEQGRSIVLPVGFTVEYNPLRWLSLVWNTQYRIHSKDNLDASEKGAANDNILYSGLGLRWKINNPKDKTIQHVRDLSSSNYEPTPCCDETIDNAQKIDEMMKQISVLLNETDSLERKFTTEDTNLPDSDSDGVPDIRDKDPNTPLGSFVNSKGEPLDKERIERILGYGRHVEETPSVYFDLGSTIFFVESHVELTKLARKMYTNPKLTLDIVGYCDNVGGEEYNNQLSMKRAEATKRELVNRYGISADRINTYGKGKTAGPVDNFAPNRRCDLILK